VIVVLVLARTFHVGSAMMLVALPYFCLVVLKPVFVAGAAESLSSFLRTMMKWLWIALALEIISGGVWFWFAAAQMSDRSPWKIPDPSELNVVLWQTQFGRLWLVRSAIGIALGLTLCSASRRNILLRRSHLPWLILALSSLLLTTLAWAGHASAGIHNHVLHLVADILHLLVGSIWPMGLIPLGSFLWHTGRRSHHPPEESEIKTLQRFSRSSRMAVVLLVATGLINAWLMLGSWYALATTLYGKLLLAKVLAAAIMIGLGACNRFYLLPRIQDGPLIARFLRRTILAESCLLMVVLLIVGIMGMTSPPN